MDPLFVQSSLDFLGRACQSQPHLRVKIAVDCVEKGYASHEQVADFLGLELKHWNCFYENFQAGDIQRIPTELRRNISRRNLRFFTGFTDDQLDILKRSVETPFLLSENIGDEHPLSKELRVLMVFGVMMRGRHNQFKSYKLRSV